MTRQGVSEMSDFVSRVSSAVKTRDIDIAILSVCPSCSGIASKLLNISSYFLQHTVTTSFHM